MKNTQYQTVACRDTFNRSHAMYIVQCTFAKAFHFPVLIFCFDSIRFSLHIGIRFSFVYVSQKSIMSWMLMSMLNQKKNTKQNTDGKLFWNIVAAIRIKVICLRKGIASRSYIWSDRSWSYLFFENRRSITVNGTNVVNNNKYGQIDLEIRSAFGNAPKYMR